MSTTNVHRRSPQGSHRWMVPLAVVTAGAMIAIWFPFSALWQQQHEIAQAAAALAAVRGEQQALDAQSHQVASTRAQRDLARADYQLVSPGQSLIQVLPGRATNGVWTLRDDPGYQPLARPDTVPAVSAHRASTRPGGGFLERLVRTLEFWR
jgi:hypothetical protein